MVEMLIYIGILVVMTIFVVNSLLMMTKSFVDFRANKELNSSALVSFERITLEIRNAKSVDDIGSIYNVNPGHLKLNTLDSAGLPTTTEFYVVGGKLVIKEGVGSEENLVSSNLSVDNLVFRKITFGGTDAIKIESTFNLTRGKVIKTKNFYSTILLRGSY